MSNNAEDRFGKIYRMNISTCKASEVNNKWKCLGYGSQHMMTSDI